ncbi:CBS domain-containing protein [Pedobacter riviphilus]|uniref:CBS domain-containing protein n=1 Tax=Pedobacter riviphilus TaxID=2766984 RepID=A0ABX6TE68_9SPHI|nr:MULTISPECIES: CBS domain-containing protein [Pedobacter]NII85249.1 CBS domain-containing protein [Pedobacter sp. SG908]NMN39837.1 CBS domain-containing protein [Pedobacter sp. SG918]QNR83200.1 CBS domain-containing protein [Pedobacter riviphilus]
MFAAEIISDAIPSLRTDDTVQKALDRMNDFKLKHLPVVNEVTLLGLVSEDDLLNIDNHDTLLSDSAVNILNVFVLGNAHAYDVIRLLSQLKLTAVPVLDQQKNYVGLISINNMVNAVAEQYAVNEPGGIIVLEISNRDNSLAHIAQIVEADNAQVLSSYVNSFEDSTRLEVTLKVNKTEITSLVASFERYDYLVKEVYNNTQIDDGSQERYDSFMNYLNV